MEVAIPADPLYQHLLLAAEKKFWRCVENGEPPRLFGLEPPRPRIEAVRIVDMGTSNAWAEFAGVFRRTREAYLEHGSRPARRPTNPGAGYRSSGDQAHRLGHCAPCRR